MNEPWISQGSYREVGLFLTTVCYAIVVTTNLMMGMEGDLITSKLIWTQQPKLS